MMIFPAGEWICFIENHGRQTSPIVSDWCMLSDTLFEGVTPILEHGNGDPGIRRDLQYIAPL